MRLPFGESNGGLCSIATILLAVLPEPSSTRPYVSHTRGEGYIGPALGKLGDNPYMGKDNVFHIGMAFPLLTKPGFGVDVCLYLVSARHVPCVSPRRQRSPPL